MRTELVQDKSTIFIVDDGDDYRFLVNQVFVRFLPQYAVCLFPSGNALLDHLKASPTLPALILLDLHMPGLSGQQILTWLKQDRSATDLATTDPASHQRPLRSVPVVVITSSSSAEEIQACYEAGANSCLVKPVGLETMRQQLTLICQYWMDTNRPVLA